MKSKALAIPLIVLSLTSAQGALLFYEDFTGFTAGGASLDGQGGWNSPGDSESVRNETYTGGGSTGSWNGTITNSTTSGGNFLAATGNTHAFGNIALSTTVTNSFAAGTTTWFSYVEYNGNNGSAGRQNVAIGAAPLTSDGGLEMAGQGIGVGTGTSSNTALATFWEPNATGDDKITASSSIGSGRPIFVISKIEWDAVSGDDRITVKRFAFSIPVGLTETDWNSEAGVSTNTANLDQSTFDTLSFANQYAYLDDIRIASDFDSAVTGTVVIPEPSALLLSSLGGLALLRRRRRS